VTIAAILIAYAALAGTLGGGLLRRGPWAARAPLPGIIIWLAAAWSVIAAGVLASLSLAVDSTAIGGQLSRVIGACVIRLRSAYATPGGRSVAWPSLAVTAIILVWAAAAVARYLGTDRRLALRHAETARLVGRRDPALGAVLLDHAVPAAYCVASRPPTVVVTSGALRALDATQLAAVLAHEHAHLRAHHQLLRAIARIARRTAPFLPLLRHADEQITRLIELHADDAASRVSGPAPLAAALAILASATPPDQSSGVAGMYDVPGVPGVSGMPGVSGEPGEPGLPGEPGVPGLSATSADVLQRIRRLLSPVAPVSPLRRRLLGAAALTLAVGPILLSLLPAIVALALGKVPAH